MSTHGDPLLRLAGEIDELGRRLTRAGAELRSLRADQSAPAPGWPPAAPPPPSAPFPQGQPWPQAQAPQGFPVAQPWQPGRHMGHWQPAGPEIEGPSLVERLGREGAGSRLLA